MKATIKNLKLVLKDQLPLKRLFYNFFITGNARGIFSKYSHVNKSGVPKVGYNTKKTAIKAADTMSQKHDVVFKSYKCLFCNKYHIGKNK